MDLKSTAQVFNETDVLAHQGVVPGVTLKALAGGGEHPSERIRVYLAHFEPGTVEKLHWHLVEAFYYVVSGRAILTDIEGKTHDMTPGTAIYAPAGIAGAHSWEVKESLQLITVRATTDPEKTMQFDVDLATKESSIGIGSLVRRNVTAFPSLY